MPSTQLSQYFQLRAGGIPVGEAAVQSGIGLTEARLWEEAVESGEASFSQGEDEMAKVTKPGDGVTNLTSTKETIRNAVPAIINLMNKRKELNAEIAEHRERVNACGVPKKALDHAIKIKQMDPDDRAKFDEGYAIARDAIGLPQSRSLFDFLGSGDDNDDEEGASGTAAESTSAPVPDAVH